MAPSRIHCGESLELTYLFGTIESEIRRALLL
jgi:hypothetical protein